MVYLKQISFSFTDQPFIKDLSLKLMPGQFVALIGPNGSGKTTLLKIILNLLKPQSGECILEESDSISYIPQRMGFNKQVPLTVEEFLQLKNPHITIAQTEEMLKKIGLTEISHRSIHSLSGGQLQRVLMGFSLLTNSQLICLDEATEGMDLAAQEIFFTELKNHAHKNNSTILFITHDVSAVSQHADRVVCMNSGKISFDGNPKSSDFHSCLHQIYGEGSWIHDHNHSH